MPSDRFVTACGHNLVAGQSVTSYLFMMDAVDCPECLMVLGNENKGLAPVGGLTINGLVDLVTEINTANGWRENTGATLDEHSPEAQISGLSSVSGSVAQVIEAVRKPRRGKDNASVLSLALANLDIFSGALIKGGLNSGAARFILNTVNEYGQPVHGSKTQAICRLRLMDTETEEATQAVLKDDIPNLTEELADITIRVLDFAGAWNEAHPDKPIDLQAAVMAKLEHNRTRGYRHGGKRA